ncbi:MAG: sulfatase-like hydrolase/transferase [Opitutaceae bacterium]
MTTIRKSRALAAAAFGLLAVLAPPAPAAAPAPVERPNLLLIVTDDQGPWDLGSAGNPHLDTPHLDALARDGVSFARYYVAPVCSPTRAGLMTGRYAFRTGLYNTRFGGDSLALGEVTVAELLRQAGYRTGLFGKWHLGRYPGYQPHQRGFDEFLGHYQGHIERYEYADQFVHNGRPVTTRGYVTELVTDAAIAFIDETRRRRPGAPFFGYVAYSAPHSPYQLDTSLAHQPTGDALITKYLRRGLALQQARIYAMIERVDANVGRLLEHLDRTGLARDTVVLFQSDNGGVSRHWTGNFRGFKAQVYEGGVRSPLFVRWPGRFPAGGVVRAQAAHVDLLPTFCELAGVAPPTDRPIDGRSLVPLLRAGQGERHQPFVYHSWNRLAPSPDTNWAISDQRHKLVGASGAASKAKAAGWQLFDLEQDPGEQRNLAAAQPERVQALRAEFLRWYGEVTRGVTFAPVPIPVGHAEENPVELQPSWARLGGEGVSYVFEAYDWDTIEGWSRPGQSAEWRLAVVRAGRYELEVDYGCAPAAAGGRLRVSAGGAGVEFTTRPTGTPNVFARGSAGVLELPAGPLTLRAEVAAPPPTGELMRLNRLRLRRLE